MCLTARKFEDAIMSVIRVQKLSMPGTGGEPAGSPFIFGKSDDAQRIPYLPAADGEAQKLRPQNRGRRGLPKGACGHRLFPGRERLPVVFRDPSTRVYREGATFGDILALYEFDVELREIMLDALLKVEAKVRSALAYEFCASYGESQSKYLDARCYATSKGAKRVLPKLLNMLDYIANKDTSHEYLACYRRAYKNVPLWVAVNAMTFGQTSKMLTALRDSEKAKIAKRFGVGNPKELSSFIRVLALYRNVCAHGERLFSHRCHVEIPDTALHAKLGIEKIGPDYACGKVDVFSAMITLRYLLRDDEFKTFKAKLVKCVNGYLSLDESIGEECLLEAMGFPAEWKKITRYII